VKINFSYVVSVLVLDVHTPASSLLTKKHCILIHV